MAGGITPGPGPPTPGPGSSSCWAGGGRSAVPWLSGGARLTFFGAGTDVEHRSTDESANHGCPDHNVGAASLHVDDLPENDDHTENDDHFNQGLAFHLSAGRTGPGRYGGSLVGVRESALHRGGAASSRKQRGTDRPAQPDV